MSTYINSHKTTKESTRITIYTTSVHAILCLTRPHTCDDSWWWHTQFIFLQHLVGTSAVPASDVSVDCMFEKAPCIGKSLSIVLVPGKSIQSELCIRPRRGSLSRHALSHSTGCTELKSQFIVGRLISDHRVVMILTTPYLKL